MKKQEQSKEELELKRREEYLLKRHKEELERKKIEKNKRDNEFFRERVRKASSERAPLTSRTKSYYRFAKEYPNKVDENGFRENRPAGKKLSPTKRVILFLVCVAVFCASFTAVKVGLELSAREPENMPEQPQITENAGMKVLHFTYNELRTGNAGVLAKLVRDNGCDAALFEFKDAEGYVAFDVDGYVGNSAGRLVPSAWETVQGLEAEGIKTFAYISCYRDRVAAEGKNSWAVKDYDSQSTVLIDTDGAAWLDPFNTEVSEYLNSLVAKAVEGGFSYVVLDNLRKPGNRGLSTAYYPAIGDTGSKINGALTAFIRLAYQTAGKDRLIVLCDPYAFMSGDSASERTGGSLLTTAAKQFAVDARISFAEDGGFDPEGLYAFIDEMPSVFVLDAFSTAENAVKETENAGGYRLFACIEKEPEITALAEKSGMENIILW